MKNKIVLTFFLILGCLTSRAQTTTNPAPLRVFIRAGVKTHGPNQHDHPRFLKEWTDLLNQRGAKAAGSMEFPTAGQLAAADVLVLFAQDGGNITPDQRAILSPFLMRGGGLVVIHDAVCGRDPEWFKTVIGGAWDYSKTGFYEGEMAFYYQDHTHPITRGASNFDFDDEMYYDMSMMPGAHVLAATYRPDARYKREGRNQPSVYDIVPQMWTYEKDNYRAFVSIPGHNWKTFELPQVRAVLLRGIAWAGKREADSLASKDELASLLYPEGGPTAPEKSGAKIVVPPDFDLKLVAAEPLVQKPISMDWDPQGRMWVAETVEYPFKHDQNRPPQDRISILDQPDSSGRFQRKTVFYEGLNLVTSMVFHRDGVIVSQAPNIYWLRDTTGSGKADTKTLLYTGFGTNDTHAVISNLRWGMDGWIYATLGYTRGDIYSADHSKHFGQVSEGVIRFKPDGSALEQFSSKGSNTWGVDSAPDGEIFFSQANGNHIDHVVMPESALARGRVGRATSYQNIEDHNRSFPLMDWKKQAYVQIDWVGNFTAAAGACIYDGGAWPAKYDYTYYVAEPTINIVHQDVLTPKGVTFVASKAAEFDGKEFVGSTDLWFRPVHMRVGPDGALYILDFYNQAAVHNDTRGPKHDPSSNAAIRPDRDHFFGRVWRVQHKQAKSPTVPNLAEASPGDLVKALDHPNAWVRFTAQRLLVEGGKTETGPALEAVVQNPASSSYAKIHALWTLHGLGLMATAKGQALLTASIRSEDPIVAKNALGVAAAQTSAPAETSTGLQQAALDRINDANPRVRLNAFLALQNEDSPPAVVQAVIKAYPSLSDDWLRSAAAGVASKAPAEFIAAALESGDSALNSLVGQLAAQIARQSDAALAARTLVAISALPAKANPGKAVVLETLARNLRSSVAPPAWSQELRTAFQSFLTAPDGALAAPALPLLARWDQAGSLAAEVKPLVTQLTAQLNDAGLSDQRRGQIAVSLLSVRRLNPEILPLVAGLSVSTTSPALQRAVIEALGKLPESAAGTALVGVYPKLPEEARDVVLNELFKRSDWSRALLDAIKSGQVNLATLGPVATSRLRTHSDAEVAKRANTLIDELRGPEMKEKNALIAQFTPIVTQPGDPAKGKQLFTQNCAVCHKFEGQGKDIAPDLTGMGAHGPAELIIHVLDPNREVEPNYYAYSIETKDGETYGGIIARENRTSVTLRNSVGDKEIPVSEITSKRNTGLSLMPNGFEALGGPALRDILAYLCASESRYRLIDLHQVFTASTSRGLWNSAEAKDETIPFRRFGLVKVDGVPFEIVNPQKVANGNNILILKGGGGVAKTMPQRVEVGNIGVKAARLHFLGGVGGWAYPCCGDDKHGNMPAAKVTVRYTDGQSEEIDLVNGREFADYIAENEVPGSKLAAGLVRRGQVRWFTKTLKHQAVIAALIFESYDNFMAPAFVSVTADMEAGSPDQATASPSAAPVPAEPLQWGPGAHVLSVGGNTSHDFTRWFDVADSATLSAGGKASVHYTERMAEVLPVLKTADVLYLSCNQALNDVELRKAIFAFADAGHGLLLIHPALWRNWRDWPEYNRLLVGGGATSHDRYGEFEVTVTDPENRLVAGVPKTFRLKDELYHFQRDTDGSPIHVLAEGRNLTTGKIWPVLWTTQRPNGKIVCCTLGHDADSHELEAYKNILRNSLAWFSEK